MLTVILMVFFASAEWVEISQNHYSKEPFRNALSDIAKSENNIYNNHSITEHQWSKGYVDRVPSVGDVQQTIQGVERKPSVKIERNSLHRVDSTIRDAPKRELISENSLRGKTKYEYRNNAGTVQRIQQSIKGEHPRYDKNNSGNKMITNKNYSNNQNKHIENESINEKMLQTTDTFKIISPDFENKSEALPIDTPEARGRTSHLETAKKNSPIKNKKISSDEPNNLMPKAENKRDKKNETKSNGLDTLIKLIKIVSQAIQRGTRKSFSGKVRYLEDLKMSLLTSIEERIESAFPDDTLTQRRRRSSGFHDSRGHVEFPSSESALMTISFLTFAVFLIKLVLQVIHTYKAKTMMVTPAVVATVGRAGNVFRIPSNN